MTTYIRNTLNYTLSFVFLFFLLNQLAMNRLSAQTLETYNLMEETIEKKADSLYFAGRPDLMIKLLEPEAKKYPDNFKIHYSLFISNTSLGRFKEGEKWLKKSLTLDETLPDIMLGFLFILKGEEEKVKQELSKAIELASSGNPELWVDIGILEAVIGDYPAAVEHFEEFERHFPSKELPVPHYASALIHIGKEEKANSILEVYKTKLKKSLDDYPQNQHFHYVLAEIAAIEGEAEKCVEHLRASLGKKLPYAFYYGLSKKNLGDPLWNKVRNHPEFQKLLLEKKKDIERMNENLETRP